MKEEKKGPASKGNERDAPTGQSHYSYWRNTCPPVGSYSLCSQPHRFNEAYSVSSMIPVQGIVKSNHYFHKLSLPTLCYAADGLRFELCVQHTT